MTSTHREADHWSWGFIPLSLIIINNIRERLRENNVFGANRCRIKGKVYYSGPALCDGQRATFEVKRLLCLSFPFVAFSSSAGVKNRSLSGALTFPSFLAPSVSFFLSSSILLCSLLRSDSTLLLYKITLPSLFPYTPLML